MRTRRLQFRSKVVIFMLPLLLPIGGAGLTSDEPGARQASAELRPVPAAALSLPNALNPEKRGDGSE